MHTFRDVQQQYGWAQGHKSWETFNSNNIHDAITCIFRSSESFNSNMYVTITHYFHTPSTATWMIDKITCIFRDIQQQHVWSWSATITLPLTSSAPSSGWRLVQCHKLMKEVSFCHNTDSKRKHSCKNKLSPCNGRQVHILHKESSIIYGFSTATFQWRIGLTKCVTNSQNFQEFLYSKSRTSTMLRGTAASSPISHLGFFRINAVNRQASSKQASCSSPAQKTTGNREQCF